MNRFLAGVVIAACGTWSAAAQQQKQCKGQCTATIVENAGALDLRDADLPFHTEHRHLRLTIRNNSGGALTIRLMNFQLKPAEGPMASKCPGTVTFAGSTEDTPCDSTSREVKANASVVFVVNASHATTYERYKFDIVATPAKGAPTTFDPELIVDP